MRMRIVVIIMLIISIGVFLVACQKKPMEKAFSNAFQQTLKKVFGEKSMRRNPINTAYTDFLDFHE